MPSQTPGGIPTRTREPTHNRPSSPAARSPGELAGSVSSGVVGWTSSGCAVGDIHPPGQEDEDAVAVIALHDDGGTELDVTGDDRRRDRHPALAVAQLDRSADGQRARVWVPLGGGGKAGVGQGGDVPGGRVGVALAWGAGGPLDDDPGLNVTTAPRPISEVRLNGRRDACTTS